MFALKVRPAGEDGFFATTIFVDDFALWYLPSGGDWTKVISKVNIVKTFGGRFPFLPEAYVGNECFAVSRTVRDRVKILEDWPEDEKIFGAA